MVDELEVTAHHEAGHLVARLLLGGRILFVSIEPNDRSHGRVRLDPRVPLCHVHAIVAAVAGPIAEWRFLAGAEPSGDDGDWQRAWDRALRQTNGNRVEALELIAELEIKATKILDRYWPAIEGTAEALIRHGRLDDGSARKASGIWRPISRPMVGR